MKWASLLPSRWGSRGVAGVGRVSPGTHGPTKPGPRHDADRIARRAGRAASLADGPFTAEPLENRCFLSAAFDLVGLTALRGDSNYAGVDGSGIGIAVLDTGVYAVHPDISPNFVAWYDAVTHNSSGMPFDHIGHGTHVAGTAASRNPQIGVATQARLISIRVLPDDNERRPSYDTVADGLQWVIDHYQQYNIRVVNMSLGVPGVNINQQQQRTDQEASRIAQLETLGVTVVTASGNFYSDFAGPGASVPAVWSTIQVANTWEDNGQGDDFPSASAGQNYAAIEYGPHADQFAASSQRSTLPNQVAAPGSTIYSTWNGAGGKLYNTISGTSMASPLVTGMVALMQDAAFTYGGVYLSPADILQIIRQSADDVVDAQTDSNARAPLIHNPDGSLSIGTISGLSETGATFKRVNIYRAIQQVRTAVQHGGNPIVPPTTDVNNTIPSATQVPDINGTRTYQYTGRIGSDGQVQDGPADIDLYRIVTDSPGVLTFASGAVAGGTNAVLSLRLFDNAGNQITLVSGNNNAGYPTLTTARLQPGTYYLGTSASPNTAYVITTGAGAAPGGTQGDYSLSIALTNPDPNGVIQGAVPFAGLPTLFHGNIGSDLGQPVGSQDVDFFEVIAPDTGTLTLDIDAVSVYGANAVDSYIRVFNESLMQIAFNDDDGMSTDSYLQVPVVKGQRLFVAVADYSNAAFNPTDPFDRSAAGPGGRYDIYFLFDNRDADGTVLSPSMGSIGTPIHSNIGMDGGFLVGADGTKDVDFYSFTPSADSLLDVSLTSEDHTLMGSLSIWQYESTQNDVIRLAEVSGDSPRLILRVAPGVQYYIAVTGRGNNGFGWFAVGSGSGGDTGNYTLSTTTRPLGDVAGLSDDAVQMGIPRVIHVGDRLSGQIGADGILVVGSQDVDLYTFTATQTRAVLIRTINPGDNGADTFLRVFNAAGQELSFNDDINSQNLASGLYFSAVAGQTYYIGVNGHSASARAYNPINGASESPGSTGPYEITIINDNRFGAAPRTVLGIASNSAGATTVTGVNSLGAPIVFRSNGAAWTAADLAARSGSPPIIGQVSTWVDPKDGLSYAVARTSSGLVIYTNVAGANWTFRNLTAETAGGVNFAADPTVFISTDGFVNIAGLNSGGDLVRYYQNGLGTAGSYQWAFVDVADDLRAQELAMPALVGRIISYVTSWNGLNVAGLDAAGAIQSIWWAPGLARWTTSNLSAITGAPPLTGGLTAYLTSWSGINLAGADATGKVSVAWWVPAFGGDWRNTNLSDLIGGPALATDSMTSWVTSWGALNIAGRQSDGRIVIYWWVPATDTWQVAPISDIIPNATLMVGPLSGHATSTGTLELVGAAATGDVIRYSWDPTRTWTQDDLTLIAVPG